MRWIVRILVAVIGVVGFALAILFMLPTERIGQLASDQLERVTGRKLRLTGEFSPTLYPVLGVKTGAIEISNADWASSPVMIEASGVVVGVKLSALLGGDLEIQKLKLIEPVIWLERGADGRENWVLEASGDGGASGNGEASGSGAPQAASSREFSLALGEISDGRVVFQDNQAGDTTEISGINAKVELPKDATTARLSGAADWQGHHVSVSADIADWQAFARGAVSAVDLEIGAGGATAGIAGMIGLGNSGLPTLDGTARLALKDVSKSLKQLGAGPLDAPFNHLTDMVVGGQVQFSDAGLFFAGNLDLNLNGLAVSAKLELTGAENWLDKLNLTTLVDVAIKDVAELHFNGDIQALDGAMAGTLKVVASNPRRLATGLGVPLDMPNGTFGSVAVSGKVRAAGNGEIVLKNARIAVDRNVLSGRVSVKNGVRPFVSADLSIKALDLSGFLSETGASGGADGTSGASGGGSTGTGWSREPIGLSGLDAVDADVRLRAGSVDLGVSKLGHTDISARLRHGQLRLNLVDVRAFDGAMSGAVMVTGGRRLSFDSDVLAKDMQLRPLLGQLLGIDRLIGKGTVKLDLSGTGVSIYDVMNSLSGSGNIKFADGSIRGINLAAMMQNLKSAFGGFEGATKFTSMTGSFHMTQGVLDNVDLSLISPLFKALGQGQVNIGGQSMNYTITPSTLSGDAEFSVPVIITGPWSNLKFQPDMAKLVNILLNGKLGETAAAKKAKEEADRIRKELKDPQTAIKDKLKAAVAKKMLNDGGATVQGQPSIEDQLKNKAEQEIGNALKNLFK